MKVLFVIYRGWPGVATALSATRDVLKKDNPDWNIKTAEYGVEGVGFPLIRELKNNPPDYLFIGGWDNNVKLIIQNVARPRTKIILEWCSPLTQSDLGGEIDRFMEAWSFVDQGLINNIGILLDTDYNVLKNIDSRFCYLPVYMNEAEMNCIRTNSSLRTDSLINVDMFCAVCSRKNIFAQSLALSTFKEKVQLHYNFAASPGATLYLYSSNAFFDNNVKNHPWMSRHDYLSVISSMDFAMQVTLSESFNYTAGEHMYQGVPVLMGVASPISRNAPSQMDGLIVKKHDDVEEICSKLDRLINDSSYREDMGEISKKYIIEFNEYNRLNLQETLMKICD